MKRIAITTLESYRRYLAGDPLLTQDALIESFINPFQGNEYTRIGTAFHLIVEQGEAVVEKLPEAGKFRVVADGYPIIFNEGQIAIALKYRAKLPYAFHEEWLGREFKTSSMPIWVHGRVDVLHGTYIRDIKTKYSKIKYDDYAESAQWKFYLDLSGLNTFYFDLFEFPNYKIEKHGYDVSSLGIKPYGAIECIRYKGMEHDNQELVEDFTDFITRNNLTQYLKDRNTEN